MNNRHAFRLSALFVMPLLLAQAGVSFAQEVQAQQGMTLAAALAEAYQKNPDLDAARAELRSVDELYPQATAGFKPSVSASADYTATHRKLDAGATSNSDPKIVALELSQSLYRGGSTVASVRESANKIKAGRARLKSAEQEVLLNGVKAYMNYLRDEKVVQLSTNNENVIATHLKASQERLRLGDVTKTDVSQAESRLAKATSSRIAAEAALKKSRAAFAQVIGVPPAGLQMPQPALTLPASEEEALAMSEKNNPFIAAARFTESAAKDTTRAVEGENLPRVDLSGAITRTHDPFAFASDDESSRVIGIRASLPLYAGGGTMSRVRQARQEESQLRLKTRSTENAVRQSVVEAWENFTAAQAESKSRQAQIDAAGLALEGVKVEVGFGSRTTLDLLDAEQEYLDAQVAHTGAETNRITAAYALLSAVGGLTAEGLNLDVKIYDPVDNFQNITRNSIETAISRLKNRK